MIGRLRWRRGVVALLAVALVGCGGGDDDDDGAADPTTPVTTDDGAATDATDDGAATDTTGATGDETTTTAEAAPEFDRDRVVRIGFDMVQANNLTLDPGNQTAQGGINDEIYYMIYGRLLRPQQDGSLVPDLAESVTVVDTQTIEVVLRDGVTFSDGTPFDAETVQAGLQRSLDNRSVNEGQFGPAFFSLSGIEVTSPNELTLTISDGAAPGWFDLYASSWQTSIVKPGEADFEAPIGAGPMVVESFSLTQSLRLVRNDAYWDAANVQVGGYEFTHVPIDQPASGMAALQSGQLDLVVSDPTLVGELSGNLLPVSRVSPNSMVLLHICKSEGPLADPNVRLALNRAIDRDLINEAVFSGSAEPANQIFPAGHPLYFDDFADVLAYDPDSARALLEEAGYADGEVVIDLYSTPLPETEITAEAMSQMLEDVGFAVNLRPGANYVSDFLEANQPGSVGVFPSEQGGIRRLDDFNGDATGNLCDYSDPELADLQQQLRGVSVSSPEAADLWRQVDEIVIGQALTGILLFRSAISAYNGDVFGEVVPWPLGQHVLPDPFHSTVLPEG